MTTTRGTRKLPAVLAVLVAVVLAVVVGTAPAYAQTVVTTTSSYTLWNGNTATTVQTFTNGVLSSVSYTEVAPSGLVVVQRNLSYYPNGVISQYQQVLTTMGGAYQTTLIRQYSSMGILLDQYVKIVSSGQTIAEQFTTYNTSGFVLTQETRILTTLAGGTQDWTVTTQTMVGGVMVSTTAQFPLGTTFAAFPLGGASGVAADDEDKNESEASVKEADDKRDTGEAQDQDERSLRSGAGKSDQRDGHSSTLGESKQSE